MSTEQTQENAGMDEGQDSTEQKPDELVMLKQRARMIGIPFSNNIGVEALRAKIEAKMTGGPDPDSKTDSLDNEGNPTVQTQNTQQNPPALQDPASPAPKVETLRQKLVRENMKLVRLRIVCLDPKKKDLPGEIITVANEHLGTVRKYVPFGEVTEDGYHVPHCIYKYLKARKFLNIRTYKDRKNNNQIRVEQNWAPEFALEVLPPLTKDELGRLAAAQAAAGGLN